MSAQGIECTKDKLLNWQCSFKIYETLWVKESRDHEAKPDVFVMDTILWITMFIGTVVSLSLIVSGFMFVMAGSNESMWEKWKKWIKYSVIWLLLVMFSYTIIQLVRYVAQG